MVCVRERIEGGKGDEEGGGGGQVRKGYPEEEVTFEQRFIGGKGEAMQTSGGREFQVEREQPVQRP